MFGIIKKMFIVVLSNISNHTKCVLLNKIKMRNSTYPYFNLHSNEYSEEFHYYPISVKLDR